MRNRPLPAPQPVPPATRAAVERFLKGLQEFRAKDIREDARLDEAKVKKYDEAGVKAFLDNMTAGSQQSIARRIMMDIMKSPTKKPTRKRSTKKKKTSPKPKSKRAPKKSGPSKRSGVKKKRASRSR